jgi:type VI secretion system secreted protein Hcp
MKDIYVECRGKYKVDGESRDSEHKGWLEVNSWSQTQSYLNYRR